MTHTLVQRLNAALCRGTGTQLSPDEVKAVRAMLEALKAVEPYIQTPRHRNCTCDWCSELRVVLDAVATAIAKAEGETT